MVLLNRLGSSEKWLSWAFGLTALNASVQGWLRGYAESVEGVTLIVINAVVGFLFLFRRRGELSVRWGEAGVCIASVLLSGVALKLAPPLGEWPPTASAVFALSGLAALAGLFALGGSFAVLPSFRGLVTRGPFRLIRHPIYAAELVMLAAAAGAAASWLAFALFVCATGLLVWRIQIEERALKGAPDYGAYQERVRWRLFPGLW